MPHGTTQWKLTTYTRQVTRKVPLTLSKAVNFLEFESRTVVTRSCGKRDCSLDKSTNTECFKKDCSKCVKLSTYFKKFCTNKQYLH